MQTPKHPSQPIVIDAIKYETMAFSLNRSAPLECATHGRTCDMNDLAVMPFSTEDRVQFAQLITFRDATLKIVVR